MSREVKWGARGVGALAAGVLLVHCGGTASREQTPEAPGPTVTQGLETPRTFTVVASADADVDQSQPDRNFGDSDTLRVGLSPQQRAFVRFDVRGLQGEVKRAVLRLYATRATDDGPRVEPTYYALEERAVTWNLHYGLGDTALADQGAIARDTWVEYDVTSWAKGNGTYLFALTADSKQGASFASRESALAERRPQLVFTTEALPDCLPHTRIAVQDGYVERTGYVSENRPTSTSGGYAPFRVKGAPDRMESYFRLNYPAPHQWTPRSVKLRLFATAGTSEGPALYPVDNTWALEGGAVRLLTWDTRPGLLGPVVDNLGLIAPNTWVEYDLTNAVEAQRLQTFGLLPESSDEVSFSSGASGGPTPQLRITLESDPFCTYRGTGGRLGWARQHGGRADERLHALATDAQGGFVTLGSIGGQPLYPPTGLRLARFDATGALLWTRQVTPESVQGRALTVTSAGDILVVGSYAGAPDLGTGPLPRTNSLANGLFLAKFSPDGQTLWSRGFFPTQTDPENPAYIGVGVSEIATDAQGSLLVVGSLTGTLDLGGPPLVTDRHIYQEPYDTHSGGFVAKFDAQGRHVWSRALAGSSYESADVGSVSTDPLGNVVLSGNLSAYAELGDGETSYPERTSFIAKYTPDGAFVWKRLFTLERGEVSQARALGEGGQVAFTVNAGGPFRFGGESYYGGEPGYDVPANVSGFLGTLSTRGEDGWLKDQRFMAAQLLAGHDGTITLTEMSGVKDLGGGVVGELMGGPRLAHYSATGAHLWSRALDPSLNDYASWNPETPWVSGPKAALLPDGGLLFGGVFGKPLQLDGVNYTPRGGTDVLFFRLQP